METLIKDQVTLDNWQVDQGLKKAKRSWKLEDNKRWKYIVNQAWQDLSHGTVWKSKSDATYPRSELSKIIGNICDNKDFVMKTNEGLVDKDGSKIKLEKKTFLKPEDLPPCECNNLSDQIKILTKALNYKQQCYLSPSESIHYKRVGPEASRISKYMYDQLLAHAIELNKKFPMIRGMVAPVKIRVAEVLEHDEGRI